MLQHKTPPVFRFAPSPNGALHLGHAYSALLNFDSANSMAGKLLIRMEDIDTSRCNSDLEQNILDDLAWLGLKWEKPVRRQSDFFETYQNALSHLENMGVTYNSTLSRGDIKRIVKNAETKGKAWPRDPDNTPLFPGRAYETAMIGKNDSFTIRLDMSAAIKKVGKTLNWQEAADTTFTSITQQCALSAQWGDVILARRDIPTSYHLSVVIDDAAQNVTHIIRGKDLKQATALHRLLQCLLELPEPLYHHHALILDEKGEKLSKSKNDIALATLRRKGMTRTDIRQKLGLV